MSTSFGVAMGNLCCVASGPDLVWVVTSTVTILCVVLWFTID